MAHWTSVTALIVLAVLVPATIADRSRVAAAGDRSAAERGFAAALRALDGVNASECVGGGLTPPSGRATCVRATPSALAAADAGLLLVQASTGADVQPFIALMGARADGEWDLWLTAPATMVPAALPASARACARGGLPVHAEPSRSAAVAGTLPEETVVRAERFQLERAGSWSRTAPAVRGEGWYQVAGLASGWVAAGSLVVADGDCGAALDR